MPLTPSLLAVALAAATSAFDHGAFDALLRAHVREGAVDYDAFGRAPAFADYLRALDRAHPEQLPEAEQLAFWLNAYNAYTIQLIVSHGERESIRNVNKTLGVLALKGPWKEPLVRAGGRVLTLDDVEHEIVRKRFREPRIHFALVCAAVSCPPLRSEAYVGARLEAQLDDQTRAFVLRSPRSNAVDVAAQRVLLSPIFDWYKQDFGGSDAALGRFLAAYHEPGPARDLLASGRFTVVLSDYDWSLNSQARRAGRK